ncbi:MAG TPA: methyltransferase domain-containing protein [Acidobacteriota bacterium]|nr:methyltransferase domain-containing protein [Acidobacteriota bacterium]
MEKKQVDLYDGTYGRFNEQLLAEIRSKAFGNDIGQNSWITDVEMRRLLQSLALSPSSTLLEVACGSGGPALFIAKTFGCKICGIDSNLNGISTAQEAASASNLSNQASFQVADANAQLPFEAQTFDAIVCMDAVNHFSNRSHILTEWHRLLKRTGRFLYTDPIVVTGPLTNEEIAIRSSIGFFLFVPQKANENWIKEADFHLVHVEDVTDDAARIAKQWHDARAARENELLVLEGEKRFKGLQSFFNVVFTLYQERRLSRYAFIGEKL